MRMEDNKERMTRAVADFETFIDLIADDVVWTIAGSTPFSRTYRDKATLLAKVLRPLLALIDGPFRATITRMLADGDHVVVEARGANLLRDGRRYDNSYCWVVRFANGKIAELTEYLDTALVMKTFGRETARP
jgi:ketosteroid isomerase-like protein